MALSIFAESIWGTVPVWLGVVGALISFAVGLWQFYRAQSWKRAEFVASEMAKLFGQPKVQMAMRLLDYSVIKLNAEGVRPKSGEKGTVFVDAVIVSALRNHITFKDGTEAFNDQEMSVREAFDAFLTGLETIGYYIKTNLVFANDVHPYLAYWLWVMLDQGSGWKDPEFYNAMNKFIDSYGFYGVRHLQKEMKKLPKPVLASKQRPSNVRADGPNKSGLDLQSGSVSHSSNC